MIARTVSRIALAEGDPDEGNLLLAAVCQAAPDAEVDLLQNGEQVIDYFYGTRRPEFPSYQTVDSGCDLVLLNLALPKLDGFKILRQLQWLFRDDLTQLPPVVVLCDSDDPETVALAFRYGAKGFLCKMTTVDQLVHAVENVLHYWLKVTLQPRRGRVARLQTYRT